MSSEETKEYENYQDKEELFNSPEYLLMRALEELEQVRILSWHRGYRDLQDITESAIATIEEAVKQLP
jgi:hypothetical protein